MRTSAALRLTAANQRQIVNIFRTARALTGSSARRLRDLGLNDSGALRGMVDAAIIRKAGPERYFLDEAVWAISRQLRGRAALRIAMVLGLVVAVMLVARMWM